MDGVTGREMACVLHEPGLLSVAGNVGRSSLRKLPAVLQLERRRIVHDTMDEICKSSVAPEHGGNKVVVAAEHSSIACQQQIFMFPADVAHADSIRR